MMNIKKEQFKNEFKVTKSLSNLRNKIEEVEDIFSMLKDKYNLIMQTTDNLNLDLSEYNGDIYYSSDKQVGCYEFTGKFIGGSGTYLMGFQSKKEWEIAREYLKEIGCIE